MPCDREQGIGTGEVLQVALSRPLAAGGGSCEGVVCDVTNDESVRRAFERVCAGGRRVDVGASSQPLTPSSAKRLCGAWDLRTR